MRILNNCIRPPTPAPTQNFVERWDTHAKQASNIGLSFLRKVAAMKLIDILISLAPYRSIPGVSTSFVDPE